jgi:hypothetical protein
MLYLPVEAINVNTPSGGGGDGVMAVKPRKGVLKKEKAPVKMTEALSNIRAAYLNQERQWQADLLRG